MSVLRHPSPEVYKRELIKLQLKKPKHWNWQLSTSKSSPQITLPIVQLYDAKGKLLLEAGENNAAEQTSWDSFEVAKSRRSPRCRSHTIEINDRDWNKRVDSIGRTREKTRNKVVRENEITIGENSEKRVKVCGLQKSRSDLLHIKADDKSEPNSLHPIRHLIEKDGNREKSKYRGHMRSRSDDLFRRKLKSSEESLKRAETDGYKNFLATRNSNDANNKNNRYKTRTSSAGTLIVVEDSFKENHRRRRQHQPEADGDSKLRYESDSLGFAVHQFDENRASMQHKVAANVATRLKMINATKPSSKRDDLFHSRSVIYPFEGSAIAYKDNKNCAYADLTRKKKRGKSRSRRLSESTCSETSHHKKNNGEKSRPRRAMSNTTAHVVQKQPKADGGVGGGNGGDEVDSDLLQLVRRLSSHDNVKMGANVSRHSSKGLSGRRSQSSGSICNGKYRGSDGKMCGSLPSYLDDRNSERGIGSTDAACNNNHHDCDCEKAPPLDEVVQRIPPLGDGAMLHWKFSDNQTVLCDQGYGSERSPEEEYPPPLPDHDSQCHHHLEPHSCYPFVTPESTFVVKLTKSSRGLGLSVTGGIDSSGSWPGLIRIKRLFPHQPASACGLLNVGDLILEANGITLTGLTNYEALEVLRTAPNQVDLKVCRPPPDVLSCVSPISEVPPPPPRREPPSTLSLQPSGSYITPEDDYYHGEFEVKLTKIQGSLGFTLRKEDDSALGHYVRALVREPALTDGRIRAGDKIIAVNDVEISSMSHEQAVQFLRQCGDVVKLRLYRDSAQTPVAALSPTETTPRASFSKKTHLRQEAVDMLNDIAVRKLIPDTNGTFTIRPASPSATSSPRKLKRAPCPSDASQPSDPSAKYAINDEEFHEGLLQQCPYPYDDPDFTLFSVESEDGERPSRPSSLDLYNPNQTPVAARKPRFNFSLAHNAYELNNLDPEILDAPNLTYNLGGDDVNTTEAECGDSFPKEPASMPHIPVENPGFSYKNPAYQSAQPQCGGKLEDNKLQGGKSDGPGRRPQEDGNMKKWKGVLFDGAEQAHAAMTLEDEFEILAIELNRGWNSRLGFSLQGAAGVTYVSAVHADSVAAKDGRLKPGDRVIKVNDESVENLSTNEIIDLLRIVRGPVCIVVSRIKSKEDCPKSNAEN